MNHSPIRRSHMVLTCAALVALGASACSSGQETPAASSSASAGGSATGKSGPLTIAYLQKQGDQQYFVDQATGAKKAAAELADVKVDVVNLGTDSNKAISELDAVIARKVDGIVIVVPDQAIGPQVIDKAKQAGIPLLASDDVIKDAAGAAAPFVGFNGTAMGTEVGKEAAQLYKTAGWKPAETVILSAGKRDLSVCTQRTDGALAAFKDAVGSEVPKVIDIGTDNSATDALNKTGAVYTANQSMKNWVVWGCNDENETGVVTGLQNAGVKPANIIGVGLGAYLTCKDWAAGQDSGNKAALFIDGAEVGRSAIAAMVAQVRDGKSLPPETIAKTTMVDKSSFKQAGVTCT